MLNTLRLLATSIVVAVTACTTPANEAPGQTQALARGDTLDAYIQQLMAREDVKGLAFAIIENDKIAQLQAYGYRNVERALPLEADTVMYGASVTKAAFAYMVLQLVDEGLIDLDRPISAYLDRPLPEYSEWTSLAGDEEWRTLTPRIILTHSTGLANLRFLEPGQDLSFHFPPGERYAYSGEGFYLLQAVLEFGLGLDVKAEMQHRVFDRFGMTRTAMQWREDFAGNLADGYAMDGSFEPHDERSYVSASGSMDTTITDQARMWRGMLAGEGLSDDMRAEWVHAQMPIRSARQFPTLAETTDPRGEAMNLAAGLGVEVWQGPNGPVFAKGGHNPWTGNMVICQETEQRCLVMLANSVRAEIIFPEIAEAALGQTNFPWWWKYPDLYDAPTRVAP